MTALRPIAIAWAITFSVICCTVIASPRSKAPTRIHQHGTPQPQQEQQDTTKEEAKFNQTIGTIYSANDELGLAVVQLTSVQRRLESRLISRDFDLNPTAVLEATNIRRNRIVGMLIISGSPSVGDEVIIPGTAYREAFGDLLISQ